MTVSTGNDYIYIMVALADWHILLILLQLEKLSGPMTGPSYYWLDLVAVDEHAELEIQLM